MSILAALTRAYGRLEQRGAVPPFGFSSEKIGFLIALNGDGSVAGKPIDLRQGSGKKRLAPPLAVPQPVKRTSAVAPNFLWDKTSYVLGVTAGDGKRVAEEHAAFVRRHREALAGTEDPGLRALLAFLEQWQPDHFTAPDWPEEMRDQNVAFCLDSERLPRTVPLHDRPAARRLWERLSAAEESAPGLCLVTGERAPIARLHPAIKGVWGGQSSGVSLVSYNKDAFESYGRRQGDNAPVSEAAAFAYTTALNEFLRSESNRIQIGDTSTVFWADASDAEAARLAEDAFFGMIGYDEVKQAEAVGDILERIRQGRPVHDFSPGLAEGVRFHVLGLAPNAARVSVRFWLEDDFGALAARYARYVAETRILPPPRHPFPPLWRYLVETAVLGKRDNVQPNLAGDCLRAILAGTPYPLTLLTAVLLRIKADGQLSALRAALLKAVLMRNFHHEESLVALDPTNRNKGYLLGRLFAVYEQIQTAALGKNLNATIKDKFYGAASAQPRKVFHLLDSGSVNHLSKLGKQRPGQRVTLEKNIAAIMELMEPGGDPFPAALSAEQQALFGLGYYHQRNAYFRSKGQDQAAPEDIPA